MYRHTQFGWVMLTSILGICLVLLAVAATLPPREASPLIISLPLLVLVLLMFLSLTVTVESGFVRLSFGIGLIRKKFRLADVKSAAPVRNSWWYGWGIRLTPHGWLFNVSGFDAVELEMKNGRRYRIGTDEPDKLTETIRGRLTGM